MTKEEVEFLTTPASRITKKKVFTVGAIGIAAFATLLLINDQVDKLRGRKEDDTTPES